MKKRNEENETEIILKIKRIFFFFFFFFFRYKNKINLIIFGKNLHENKIHKIFYIKLKKLQ